MRAFVGAGMLAMMASAAGAVDLAPVSAPAAIYDWTGFYIGGFGGWGQSRQVEVAGRTSNSDALSGAIAGGVLGANWQTGVAVLGAEVDAAWSGIKYQEAVGAVTLADKVTWLGSATARAGVAIGPALVYGKAGYAWANNELSGTLGAVTLSEAHVLSGWTAGGGVEVLFDPRWSARAEYGYTSLGSATYLQQFGGVSLGGSLHTVKAGINYHFR